MKLITTTIIIVLFVCALISPLLKYIFRGIPKNIDESWERYIISSNVVDDELTFTIEKDVSPIAVYKDNYDIRIGYDQQVCSFTYRNTGPYYCSEMPNWIIYFDNKFEAVVIEEYSSDEDVSDGRITGMPIYHLGVSENKLFFNKSSEDIFELLNEFSRTYRSGF